jgi:hypothetical protein
MITSLLPAWLETRICLRLRQHGLNPVYLVQCLFLLCLLFLCVAYGCAVVDEKRSHHCCDTVTVPQNCLKKLLKCFVVTSGMGQDHVSKKATADPTGRRQSCSSVALSPTWRDHVAKVSADSRRRRQSCSRIVLPFTGRDQVAKMAAEPPRRKETCTKVSMVP